MFTLFKGDCKSPLSFLPDNSVHLILTSPPYNVGKAYETITDIETYLSSLESIMGELHRVLSPSGSLCWQVGNSVLKGEVFPLDILFYPRLKKYGLTLRNRIVWTYDHGLHAKHRFSGRYETVLWFTKGENYTFNLDAVRVPSKYPGKKHFKGPRKGELSGNPLGKNPGDIWTFLSEEWDKGVWHIPNVKSNHPEKTEHPCQFPIELAERFILALTNPGDLILDPFAGAGTTLIAGLMHDRQVIGCEKEPEYIEIIEKRKKAWEQGNLPYRPLGKPIYQPAPKV